MTKKTESDMIKFELRFPDAKGRQLATFTSGVRDAIKKASAEASAEPASSDPSTQGLDAVVVLLGTPAVLVVARAIAAYIRKHRLRIELKKGRGSFVFDSESGTEERIAEKVAAKQTKKGK